jgi:hypothetical protein
MQKQDYKTKVVCGGCGRSLKVPDKFPSPYGKCPRCGNRVINPYRIPSKNNKDCFRKQTLVERIFEIRYDELTCFLLSSAVLITLILNFDVIAGWFAKFYNVLMTGNQSGDISNLSLWGYLRSVVVITLMFLGLSLGIISYVAGFLYSFYHVFTRKSKSDDKFFMVTFAMLTNSISGFAAAYSMYMEKLWLEKWYLGIFPLWAWVNSIFLLCRLFQSTEQPADTEEFEDILADDAATPAQVIIALIVLLTVFGFCLFVFNLNWAITLSISVAYATSFSKAFGSIFLGKKGLEQPIGVN